MFKTLRKNKIAFNGKKKNIGSKDIGNGFG